MRNNARKVLLLATFMTVLSGCAVTEEYDLYEIANIAKTMFFEEVLNMNLPYARTVKNCDAELSQNQKVIAREYGEYSVVRFPQEYAGTDYCFPYVEDIANAYHVTKFEGVAGTPIEFEWIGSIELGREIHEIAELESANYIELTDSSDMARLFAMSQSYENDVLDTPEEIMWNLYIDTDVVVVRDGLCEISNQDEGYHVLLDVESKTRKGYASVFVDTSADTMTHFVYTEVLEQYDDERARTFIDNLQLSDGIITQKKDKICVEAGEKIEFIPSEYLDGNPWELSQCILEEENKVWRDIGGYSWTISLLEETYPLQVEVVDTTPPEYELSTISGFAIEGMTLNIDKYITDSLFEDTIRDVDKYISARAKDFSKPLKVYYKDLTNETIVTEELCDEEGNINVTICIEDAAGNVTEKTTKFVYIEKSYDNTWMEKVGFDVSYFWDLVFLEYEIELMYSEYVGVSELEKLRKQNEEWWGLDRAKEGIDIAESGLIDIQYEIDGTDNMKEFYEGLSYIPENILQEYAERGWCLNIIDEEMNNQITGGDSTGKISSKSRRIWYTTAYSQSVKTIIHEFGHFVDYILGMKSESASFQKLYRERKNSSTVAKRENAWQDYDTDGIYSGYSYANEHEFFADSFEVCLIEPEKMKRKNPKIYDYIMKCIDEL